MNICCKVLFVLQALTIFSTPSCTNTDKNCPPRNQCKLRNGEKVCVSVLNKGCSSQSECEDSQGTSSLYCSGSVSDGTCHLVTDVGQQCQENTECGKSAFFFIATIFVATCETC